MRTLPNRKFDYADCELARGCAVRTLHRGTRGRYDMFVVMNDAKDKVQLARFFGHDVINGVRLDGEFCGYGHNNIIALTYKILINPT